MPERRGGDCDSFQFGRVLFRSIDGKNIFSMVNIFGVPFISYRRCLKAISPGTSWMLKCPSASVTAHVPAPRSAVIDKFQWLTAGFVIIVPEILCWLRTGCREQAHKRNRKKTVFHWPGFDILCEFVVQSYIKSLALVFICYFCGEVFKYKIMKTIKLITCNDAVQAHIIQEHLLTKASTSVT